jgi:cytochrome oxidase complex assembly protein 1
MSYVPPPPPPPAAPPPPPQQKSSGCLKWGLIGCGALLVLGVVFVVGIVIIVFGAIKTTDIYRGARATAERDPRVIEALGTPIETGIWVSGSVNVEGGTGRANIEFPIHGPKGRARVHAVASKEGGSWRYSELTVTPSNGPPIDLLKP